MNPCLARTRLAAPFLLLTCLAPRTVSAQAELGGTSWRLVRFQGSDDTALTRVPVSDTRSLSRPTAG